MTDSNEEGIKWFKHMTGEDLKEKKFSLIKLNALMDPDYTPYCMRCTRLVRMVKIETLYWRCSCGAEHDERDDRNEYGASRSNPQCPIGPDCKDCK